MIQKAVLEKTINQTFSHNQNIAPNNEQKKSKFLKDISNSLKTSSYVDEIIDFKELYELEQQRTTQLCQKVQVLQQKIRLLEQQNQRLRHELSEQKYKNPSTAQISTKKKSHKQILFQQIRSFKENLPNSMKVIQFEELDNFESVNFLTDEQIMSKNDVMNHGQIDSKLKVPSSNNDLPSEQHLNKKDKSLAVSSVTMKIINDQSLVDCLAMYGLTEQAKYNEEQQDYFYTGELTYCSKAPHQIIKHSSKLVYPENISKSKISIYRDESAVQTAVSLISDTLKSQDIKAFTLIFQPATIPNEDDCDQMDFEERKQHQIINLINKQRRFYSICISFNDFDIVENPAKDRFADLSFQNSLEEDIFKDNIHEIQEHSGKIEQSNKQSQIIKEMKGQQVSSIQKEQSYAIRVSRKVLSVFTKYPFFPFFEELLTHCLVQSFHFRKEQMKKNLAQLKNFQHSKTIDFLKTFFTKLQSQFKLGHRFQPKINQIFEIKFMSAYKSRYETISLQLSKTLLKNYYSQIWAYPLLRLFTLDSFLQTFTLIMLEEKVIFVCQNENILTSAIFLFSKVLVKPFNYPYPVVSIIPNEYDYFNAPFPIIYGCLNSKQNLLRDKIPKIYKNVYVVLTPLGVEILHHKNSSKIQLRKSPKLRDKLLPCFIKMESQQKEWNNDKSEGSQRFSGLSSFLGLGNSNSGSVSPFRSKNRFNFSNNNRQLSHQIIEKVHHFLNGIREKLPSQDQVKELRAKIQEELKEKSNKQIDADKQTYERVKNKLLKRTSDPFVQRFLETQIVGMEILH